MELSRHDDNIFIRLKCGGGILSCLEDLRMNTI